MAIDFMKVFKGINFAGQASAPSSPANGDVYYDTTLQKLRCYQNGAWVNLSDSDGTVLLSDGTVGAPSLAFLNETGLGLYRQGAGVLAIAQGGADLMTFDAAKIQTEEPLHVDKNIYIGQAGQFPVGVDNHTLILRTDGTGSAPFDQAGTAIYRSRVSSTAGRSSHLFYTGSPTTLAMSIDENQKITLGASGGTQNHLVNGNFNLAAQGQLRLQDTTGGEYVGHRAPGTVTSSHTYTWPAALPGADRILQSDSSGNLSWVVAGAGSGDISNGGNSFGSAITIGTNDAFDLNFETNNVVKGSVTSAGLWTLGASGGTQTHVVNGDLTIIRRVGFGASPSSTNIVARVSRSSAVSGINVYGLYSDPVWTSSEGSTEAAAIVAQNRGDATFNAARATALYVPSNNYTAGAAVTRVMGLQVIDQTQGSTGNASICDNVSFTGNWFLNQSGTNPSTLNGSLRVGTTSIRSASFEQASILQIVEAANVGSSHSALTLHSFNDKTDTTAKNSGLLILVDRSTSVDRTDTSYLTGQEQFIRFYPSAGTTYTNNSGNGVSHFFLSGPQNNGSGSLAISQFYGIRFNSNTVNSGTRKTAISFGSWSGATNNAFIADNSTYTGDWFINSTSTNSSRLSGRIGIGKDPIADRILYVGSTSTTLLTGTNQRIIEVGGTNFNSNATGSCVSFASNCSALPTTGSMTHFNHIQASVTGTVTRERAFGISEKAIGAGSVTNFAGIADNLTFTGDWFINSTSTHASLISGSVTLGASAGTAVHQLNGGVRHTVRSISGATTLDTTTTDYIVLANSSSAAFTVTLPAATSGRKIIIKDSGGSAQTNNITVSPASGTIDGAASFVINNNYQSIDLVSDGTNWFAV